MNYLEEFESNDLQGNKLSYKYPQLYSHNYNYKREREREREREKREREELECCVCPRSKVFIVNLNYLFFFSVFPFFLGQYN